jgi:hypothetical protein
MVAWPNHGCTTFTFHVTFCISIKLHRVIAHVEAETTANVPFSGMKEIKNLNTYDNDRLCGLVVRVLGYRSGGPGSIPGTTRKKK